MVCPVCIIAPLAITSAGGTSAAIYKFKNNLRNHWLLITILIIITIASIYFTFYYKKNCGDKCKNPELL